MERKARESIEAANALLQREDPCTNAITNRAYYAAYHAIWAKLLELDVPVPVARGARYFAHKRNPDRESIVEAAERHEVLTDGELFDLETLLRLRVKADYGPDDVVEEESRECLAMAEAIVRRLLGEEEK